MAFLLQQVICLRKMLSLLCLVGFQTRAPVGDYFLTIFAATKGPVYFLKDTMCVYRLMALNSWSSRPKTMEWHNKYYYGLKYSLDQFNDMSEGKYNKSISARKGQLLADNIREYTKFDKKRAFIKLVKHFTEIGFTNNIVILNRIVFK